MSNLGKLLVNMRIPRELYYSYKKVCKKYGYSISGRMRRLIEKDYELITKFHKEEDSDEYKSLDEIKKLDKEWYEKCKSEEEKKKNINKEK